MTRFAIYTASCTSANETYIGRIRASQWRAMRELWAEFAFTSRWIDQIGAIPETPENARAFWQQDLEDISRSDALVLYAEPSDTLRGALVETGMAIALRKRVLLVGQNALFGTWQFHPRVSRVKTQDEAYGALHRMADESQQLEIW